MEVVLNPHNLGKVNLSIVSKNGDVSAKFIVENEMVKEALEINMESLKERFDKQGITVNAIEVVVAEGDMFNEGGAGTGQNRQQERRRSNYVDDETITVNTQEIREEILAEMMQENGNQVNYSA
jgi:flagellar hook-length control protein FliK